MGITLAIFNSVGKIPWIRDKLMTCVKSGVNSALHNFNNLVDKNCDPGLFFGFSLAIIFSMSRQETF